MQSPLRLALATLVVTVVGLVAPITAVRPQQPSSPALPDFDIRQGRPLSTFTPGVRVLDFPGVRVSRTIAAPALRNVVRSLAERLGLESSDLASMTLERDYTTRSNGVRTVVFSQTVDGVPVFGAVVSVHVGVSGDIVRVTSSAGRADGRRRGTQVAVDQAVSAAAANVRPGMPFSPARLADDAGRARFARGQFRRDLMASLTWLPVDGVLRLAWHVTVEPESDSELYDVLIDAETGEVLLRQNRVHFTEGSGRVMQSAAMNAFDPRRLDPIPAGQPGTACPPPSNYAVRSLTAPFRDPGTVLFGTGRLSGNNVHVFRHDSSTEGALGTFDGAKWNFDFPFNTDDSAETALFFALNFAHDFFYDLGFDEASGNFQVDNFNRGGVGGDPIKGIARALGRNNANYVHAVDGTSPRINMFLWDSSNCWAEDVDNDGFADVDGDYDFDIIIHEFHHGVSLRLNTGFSGSEAGAIGEGGGDFFAYSVNGDTLLADFAWPGGLRTVNAKTYADWYCRIGLFCEVHDNGEIWANVLWDARERFRIDHVRGSEAAGVNEAHQLYVDALKLSPPFTTMLDMRDAMLLADTLRNPAGERSANFCRLWEAFGGRGMGTAAVDTATNGFSSVVANFSVPDGCVAPPVSLPTVTIAATAPSAAESGPVSGAFTISRGVASADAVTVNYGVSGTAVNGTDYQAVTFSATIPAGAAEVVVPIVPIDDTLLEPNETVNVRLRSGGPYIVGVPVTASVTIASDDVAADLTLSSLTAPSSSAAGLGIDVSETTINQGTGPAAPSTTSFYLSRDVLLDASDELVGSRAVPALSPGATSAAVTTVILPDPLDAGSYTLFAKADGPGSIAESNEFNNTRLTIIQIGPDLTISAFSAPASAGAGTSITVTDTTSNPGKGAAAASTTRFYLSTDFTLDAGDTPLQDRAVPALAGLASNAASTSMTIPASTADGTYYLIAKADGPNLVAESSETNNTRSVVLRVGPDLVVSSLTAPARAAAGSTISVTETTQNAGTGVAGASVTAFYLSANILLDASDQRLTERSVSSLGAGGSSVRTTTLTVPAVAAGTWYVIAAADDLKTVTETNEANNTRSASMLIGPDLTVALVSLPFTVAAGAVVSLTDTVRNAGAADAAPSVIRFYLSQNTQLDASDQVLGERQVPLVAANLTSSGTTSITIPTGISGTHYIIAVADATGVVAEASETNNLFLRVVQITP